MTKGRFLGGLRPFKYAPTLMFEMLLCWEYNELSRNDFDCKERFDLALIQCRRKYASVFLN